MAQGTSTLRLIIVSILISLASIVGSSQAEVLVLSPDGTYRTKSSLAVASTAADVAGKTVIVTSPQVVTTAIAWPPDRAIEFKQGGYVTFTGAGAFTGLREARPEWFGTGDVALSNAIAAASQTVIITDLTITKAATVNKAIKIKGGKITQSTLNANCFNVTASNVTFEDLEIVGNNGIHQPAETTEYNQSSKILSTKWCGIYADGSRLSRIKALTIRNCKIHGFNYCIRALWNDGFTLTHSHLYDSHIGVYGGVGWDGDYRSEQNIKDLSYTISNNTIIVSYGSRVYARPIALQNNGGNAFISNNMLRGGGMSFENTQDYVLATRDKRVIVTGNDCDTSISGGNVIADNVIDASLSPTDRGPQYGIGIPIGNEFYQAIEPFPYATVTGNVVRNIAIGVANLSEYGPTITGNTFENIGRTVRDMPGVIAFHNDITSDTLSGTIISNNKFKNIGPMPLLNLQWGVSHPHILSDIIFDSNIVEGADSFGFLVKNVKNLRITNNLITNCNRLDKSDTAFFLWEDGLVEGYYSGNSIVRTLTSQFGTNYAFANIGRSVAGYNSFSGLRSRAFTNPERVQYSSPVSSVNGVVTSQLRESSHTPAGNLTPLFIGEMVHDSATGDFYIGYNTSGNKSWKRITP